MVLLTVRGVAYASQDKNCSVSTSEMFRGRTAVVSFNLVACGNGILLMVGCCKISTNSVVYLVMKEAKWE